MSKFDELLAELTEAGDLDEEIAQRIKKASDGSPLRKEKEEAVEKANKLQGYVTKSVFEKAGIKVKPEALNLPDDLDITDEVKVKDWAVGLGLVEPAALSEEEQKEQAAQRELDQATGKAEAPPEGSLTPEKVAAWSVEKMTEFSKKYPREWEELKRGNPVAGEAATFV